MQNAIPYKGELYEDFDSLEYTEWEDALDHVKGSTKAERDASTQWITYDFLISKGHFVHKPDVERPPKDVVSNVPPIPVDAPMTWRRREPDWTPSRILTEREKIVRAREKLLNDKQVFSREMARIKNSRKQGRQFYHEDGVPYNTTSYVKAIITLTVVVAILLSLVIICVTSRIH